MGQAFKHMEPDLRKPPQFDNVKMKPMTLCNEYIKDETMT